MVAETLLALLLGLVFLASAVPKLRYPKGFVLTVLQYQVLPPSLGERYARALPSLESLAAVLLLSGTAGRAASFLAALLLLSFCVGVAINLVRGRGVACGCFGVPAGRTISASLLLEDIALLVIALVLAWAAPSWLGPQAWAEFGAGDAPPADALRISACVALVIAGVVIVPRSAQSRGKWRVPSIERQPASSITGRGER